MKVLVAAAAVGPLLASFAWSQQANVNLDWNPQKNTENLVPFSAPLNSPDVRDDRAGTFRLKAPLARFTESDRQVMHFRNEAHPGPVPSAKALEELDAYFAWRRTPECDAWAK